MKRLIQLIWLVILMPVQAADAPAASTDFLPRLPEGKSWRLAWHDEFDGAILDTNKWDIMGDWKRRDGFWVKEDSYLDGKGNLVLRTKKDGERFTCGAIRTLGKFEHRFGYWVMRAKLPTQPGHWPAFWLMSSGVGKVGNDGRDGTEIDIVEVPWRDGQITFNLHWDGYGKNHKSAGSKVTIPEVMHGFHTYAMNWTPEEYVFYVDGKEVWRSKAGGVSQAPEYLKLTEEIGNWAGDIKKAQLPDYFEVDYVRVYDVAEGGSAGERGAASPGASPVIRKLKTSESADRASLRVLTGEKSPYPIPSYITGKFCEHLGNNIYNGMDAQILRNPSLADYPFWSGQTTPDGVTTFLHDRDQINRELRRQAERLGWPASEIERLVEARNDGLAAWWLREGSRAEVIVSPDSGPFGGRAQRVELKSAGHGLAQWAWLPLHRAREYEFQVYARSPELKSLSIQFYRTGEDKPCASTPLAGLSAEWRWLKASLRLNDGDSAEGLYRLAILADAPGQLLISRAFLRPADHIHGADPDVIKLLRDSKLPILRWPGGNFVSGYHWKDGVGPMEKRPTRPNYAWGGVEPNFFGTDEFIQFCRDVGCEPMICLNGGDGSPQEAAQWVEYCNGPATSPMGTLRAANGHPEPYKVKHWEIGNELWGRWQVHWTTAKGYVDRYKQFVPAVKSADPTIQIYACGAPVFWGKNWNDTLIAGASDLLSTTTDHPLIGGNVPTSTDPWDVYRDFMAVPEVLEQKWRALWQDMEKGGVKQPRLAVTELQLFAHLGPAGGADQPVKLTRENLVNPGTHGEALYDALIYHAAIRLAPFVSMVTHSATVNHGGGLRKERERVYANPCHFAQSAFADFAGATPVALELTSPMVNAPLVLPELKNATSACAYSVVDALAALAKDGSLLLSIVHRGADQPIQLDVVLDDFKTDAKAEVRTLNADVPWAANTLKEPRAVSPTDSQVALREGHLLLDLKPASVLRVRVPKHN